VGLGTPALVAAKAFYSGVFGWELEDTGAGGVYTVCRVDGDAVRGLYELSEEMQAASVSPNWMSSNAAIFSTPDGSPSYWHACFAVESTEDAVKRVHELGGQQLSEPLDIGHGTVAMVRDPQGSVFTVFAGETHP
jgi:uncharacterized protein